MAQLIQSVNQLDFQLNDIPDMPLPEEVLMVRPLHFSVDYVINPHMADNVDKVDKIKAQKEWQQVRDLFEETGLNVRVIEDQEGLPDMVFCANQSLPYIDGEGNRHAIMSEMHADQRKKEVPYFEQWYRQNGYKVHFFEESSISDFEGCGDAIWHSGKQLLWGGYGFRSSPEAYRRISDHFDIPIITLELVDESFYHLDTCFCILDEKNVLIYPEAFTDEGLELINTVFDQVIEASQHEAKDLFACNASCPDGENVIIQEGCTEVNKKMRDNGFTVHETSTAEFLKSGGSVFCMKMLLW